jgi:hypothetical protein
VTEVGGGDGCYVWACLFCLFDRFYFMLEYLIRRIISTSLLSRTISLYPLSTPMCNNIVCTGAWN